MSGTDSADTVSVIGAGKVGTAMAVVLSSRGYDVAKVCDTSGERRERAAKLVDAGATDDCVDAARDVDIVLLTTPDGAIEGVCRRIADSGLEIAGKIFIHMSGAVPLSDRSLEATASLIEAGERSDGVIREEIERVISGEPLVNLEYIAICDNIYLQPLAELSGEALVALAARVGTTRLIDNMVFNVE